MSFQDWMCKREARCCVCIHPSKDGTWTIAFSMSKILGQHTRSRGASWKNMYWTPIRRILLWARKLEEILLEEGWGKVLGWQCLYFHRKKKAFVDDIKMGGKKQKFEGNVEKGQSGSRRTHSGAGSGMLGMRKRNKINLGHSCRWPQLIHSRPGCNQTTMSHHERMTCMTCSNMGREVRFTCQQKIDHLFKMSTPCMEDHQFEK